MFQPGNGQTDGASQGHALLCELDEQLVQTRPFSWKSSNITSGGA